MPACPAVMVVHHLYKTPNSFPMAGKILMATVTVTMKHLTKIQLTIQGTTNFHLMVTATATVTVTATAMVTVKHMVTSCLGITLTTVPTVPEAPRATDTLALITISSWKILGPA